jgi:hypothetical protein
MRCIWPFRRSCSVPENACFKVLTHPISAINAPNMFPLRTQRMSSSLSETSQRTKGQLLGREADFHTEGILITFTWVRSPSGVICTRPLTRFARSLSPCIHGGVASQKQAFSERSWPLTSTAKNQQVATSLEAEFFGTSAVFEIAFHWEARLESDLRHVRLFSF